MGTSPSQHLEAEQQQQQQQQQQPGFVLQDDMGVVIALPPPSPPSSHASFFKRPKTSASPAPPPPLLLWGKRILEILEDSPASNSGLVPWLDFLVGTNGKYYGQEDDTVLPRALDGDEPQQVSFQVFNIKTNSLRECVLGREVVLGREKLGLKLGDWQTPVGWENCFKVLGVDRQSPAQDAGLEPEVDYLMGTTDNKEFTCFGDLEMLLVEAEGDEVELFVYNSKQDDVRVCVLAPHRKWGDEDALFGADLANGLLHRLPQSCRRSSGRRRRPGGNGTDSMGQVGQWVRTTEGMGQVLQVFHQPSPVPPPSQDGEAANLEEEHSYLVKLDWGFGNDAQVVGKFLAKHVEPGV
ncbi:hypothetical protein BASA81_013827 [Batrachochytrium salamandrivorans]|nr:hypothetical protein BASA81_013827 [Batrachochytrium salamandrivorans]